MKKFLKLLVVLPFAASLSSIACAQDVDLSEVDLNEITMDIAEDARGFRHKRGHHAFHSTVIDYMLANGDITQEELDAMKANREAVRDELRALKEAGDKDALQARIRELREEQKAKRDELREYVQNHEDLAEAIAERRKEIREKRREKIRDRREKREVRDDA